MKDETNFREKERILVDESIPETPEVVQSSPGLKLFGRAAKSVAPKAYESAETAVRYLTGEEKAPTLAEIVLSGAKEIAHYFFPKTSEKFGYKVFGKYWDPQAYAIVESTLAENISEQYKLTHVPEKYGKIKYNGKSVWGKQDGQTAFYVENFEEALGKAYGKYVRKSGLSEKEFRKAGQEYIKFHEEVEHAYQVAIEKNELSEYDHGKIQAYLLKSLKELGKYDVYSVGVLIDSQRNDIFGHYIEEHAPEDVKFDLRKAAFALA